MSARLPSWPALALFLALVAAGPALAFTAGEDRNASAAGVDRVIPATAQRDSTLSADQMPLAVLLFLTYEAPGRPSFDADSVHQGAWDRLCADLGRSGRPSVPRGTIEPLLYAWQVRNDTVISLEFLSAVSASLKAGRILIVNLSLYSDRLLLTARMVRTDTGELTWAGVEEDPYPAAFSLDQNPGVAACLKAIEPGFQRFCRQPEESAPPSAGTPLYLLPVRRDGIDAATTRVVTHCLLRSLLGAHWSVEDPGVTFARLSAAGLDPDGFDRRVRPELSKVRGPCTVLVGGVINYEKPARIQTAPVESGPTAESAQPRIPPAALSLRLINGDSGELLFADTEYMEVPVSHGLFGMVRNPSLESRISPTVDRLVLALSQKRTGSRP